MAIHWKILFKSLRAGTDYTVNIHDSSYSGSPVILKGGADPFVTQEDDSDDMFVPIRTQSGYLRIVDDGRDATGNTFNWKEILPASAMSLPVTLTVGNTVVWQGYLQTQNFSGELYGTPQEREFPVQCGLSVLGSIYPTTQDVGLHSFAYLAHFALMASGLTFNYIYFQGGADARAWLQNRFCWKNFLSEDDEGNLTTKYSVFSMLEDMCRFWGWTCRTHGQDVYFTCADDPSEQTFLKLTSEQLADLAADDTGESIIGTIENVPAAFTLSGDIFSSRENEDYVMRGPSKATVKADVNEQSTIVEFAPAVIEREMEAVQGGYQWHGDPDEDMVGCFMTPVVNSVPNTGTVSDIRGYAHNIGSGFFRQQAYERSETTSPSIYDTFIVIDRWKKDGSVVIIDTPRGRKSWNNGTVVNQVELETVYPMDYTGGSIQLKCSVLEDIFRNFTDTDVLWINIGIGMTKATAKWWNTDWIYGDDVINCGWQSTKPADGFPVWIEGGNIYTLSIWNAMRVHVSPADAWFRADIAIKSANIPIPDEDGFFGNVYLEFYGCENLEPVCIGNLEIIFSRDKTELPVTTDTVRPRMMVEKRVSMMRYTAQNNMHASEEWNANCIFASDNNMKFGYGLLLGPTGGYVSTVPYGVNMEHPEQHLADRVSAYWTMSRRKITAKLRSDIAAVRNVLPAQRVNLDGSTFIPSAISHDWRDDVTQISFAQL